jgi:hypothetical protein
VSPRLGLAGCRKYDLHRDFSLFVLLLSFALTFLFLFIVFLYILCPRVLFPVTHNTNLHASCVIRILNSSKRSAADPRLRPLDHNPETSSPQAVAVPTDPCWLRATDRGQCKVSNLRVPIVLYTTNTNTRATHPSRRKDS